MNNLAYFVICLQFSYICTSFYSGFSLNGELMMDASGSETAFSDVQGDAFVPALSLGIGQKAHLVFGHDINHLKFFTTYGLQEGYEPFCV